MATSIYLILSSMFNSMYAFTRPQLLLRNIHVRNYAKKTVDTGKSGKSVKSGNVESASVKGEEVKSEEIRESTAAGRKGGDSVLRNDPIQEKAQLENEYFFKKNIKDIQQLRRKQGKNKANPRPNKSKKTKK